MLVSKDSMDVCQFVSEVCDIHPGLGCFFLYQRLLVSSIRGNEIQTRNDGNTLQPIREMGTWVKRFYVVATSHVNL